MGDRHKISEAAPQRPHEATGPPAGAPPANMDGDLNDLEADVLLHRSQTDDGGALFEGDFVNECVNIHGTIRN